MVNVASSRTANIDGLLLSGITPKPAGAAATLKEARREDRGWT